MLPIVSGKWYQLTLLDDEEHCLLKVCHRWALILWTDGGDNFYHNLAFGYDWFRWDKLNCVSFQINHLQSCDFCLLQQLLVFRMRQKPQCLFKSEPFDLSCLAWGCF